MKKFLLFFLFIFLFGNTLYAAESVDISVEHASKTSFSRIKIEYVSDGSDLEEFTLTTNTLGNYLSSTAMKYLKGKLLVGVETDPGTGVNAAYTISIDSDNGADICTIPARSTTDPEYYNVLGADVTYFMADDLQIDFSDIGNDADTVTAYLDFR